MNNEILKKIKDAGVVGAGGAGFPTHIKLNASVDYVIVNGAECEPLLRVNQQMMAKYADELWESLQNIVHLTGAKKGIIALKKKYSKAHVAIEACKPENKDYYIHLLDDFYPAGDEHVLVHEVTGRIVPESGIPLKVGCVVINVETLLNVLWAIKDMPVIKKFITITGAVRKPLTIKVPIGTKIETLVDIAGGALVDQYGIIDGGPMMGKIVDNNHVVTKTTGGIIILPAHHFLISHKNQSMQLSILRARAACCQCRICTDLCPRYLLGHTLEPHKIMRAISSNFEIDQLSKAYLCSECGACDKFACPMGLSPRQINIMLKQELTKQGIKNNHKQSELKTRTEREWHKIPTSRLIGRLGLEKYNLSAPLVDIEVEPEEVNIPLLQHLGKTAIPVVKIGDQVNIGQLIGTIPDQNSLGANVHASITGKVVSIGSKITIKRH